MLSEKKIVTIEFNRSRLRERNKDLSALLELSNLLSGALGLTTFLEKALRLLLGHFHLDSGRVYLLDAEAQRLMLTAYLGLDVSGLEEIRLDQGFSGKAVRTNSFIAQRVSELPDKERARLLCSRGLEVVLCVPMIVMDRAIGVLNLGSRADMSLREEDADLLMIMAHQIGVACSHTKTYADLQQRLAEIEDKKETIKLFAYSASHDLKNPAVGLHGLMKRLQREYGPLMDERGQRYVDQVVKSSHQMLCLVEQINAYIAAKEAPLRIGPVNVKEILTRLREEFILQLEGRGIHWIEPPDLPLIAADELRVTRIFRNLLDNALKYGGSGLGEIRIAYADRGQHHIFSVSDNGVGMAPDAAQRLFEPFQRHATSKGTEGSGLGLSIVRELAKRHSGDVWVESAPGRGTAFHFSLSKALPSLEAAPSVNANSAA